MGLHLPVMLQEVLDILEPQPGFYVDCTFGRGGYTKALLDSHPHIHVLAIDRDPDAIHWGTTFLKPQYGERLILAHHLFSDLSIPIRENKIPLLQGIVFDLGVSSPQLDSPERGFSFLTDGPLDMGMGLHSRKASDFLNTESEATIQDVLKTLGEERYAKTLAQRIVQKRRSKPFETCQDLVQLIIQTVQPDISGIHPATRTFQAIRLWVNQELSELEHTLTIAPSFLDAGGKLVVLSFHSLEDRLVKNFLRQPPRSNRHRLPLSPSQQEKTSFQLSPSKKPLRPSQAECTKNPRARSARLRWATKHFIQENST